MPIQETLVEIQPTRPPDVPEVEAFDGEPPSLMWLEVTGKCPLSCGHCYAGSGPEGTHGTMEPDDWMRAIDEGREAGIKNVQFIGGEPMVYSHLDELISYARETGMSVEIYTNLMYVPRELWSVLGGQDVSLATSWYSDDPEVHDEITGVRGSYRKTLGNITEARQRGIPLRVGMIEVEEGQDIGQVVQPLVAAGVEPDSIRVDRKRQFGRARPFDSSPALDLGELCGHCVDTVAILPDGTVTPCVFSRQLDAGNVQVDGLTQVLAGGLRERRAELAEAFDETTLGPPYCPPRLTECRPVRDPAPCRPQTETCKPKRDDPNCPPFRPRP
jgi:MoaA/NifB/PqqE/SkfB family radical SAM enzyme